MLFLAGCGERQPPVDQLIRQAEQHLDAGQIDHAITLLERCHERAPQRVDVLEPLAFAYAANGDPAMAALTFSRVAELNPDRPVFLLYAAESLLEAGDPGGAIDRYEAYLARQPGDRAVWSTLGELRVAQGRLSAGIEALLAAEQLEPRSRQQIAIGELYLRSANLAQAQSWYARALSGEAQYRDQALMGLMETAVRARRFSDAEALLGQLDSEFPGLVDKSALAPVRGQLAEWRRRQETAKQALAALQERPPAAITSPEEDPPPAEPVAEAEPEAEPAAAEVPVETPLAGETAVVVIEPPAPDPLTLGRESRAAGDFAEAVQFFKQALVADDSQPLLWVELSELYLESGEDSWAYATASEALRRDPGSPAVMLHYLRTAQRALEPDAVLREMENAYRLFPDQPEIVLVLARSYAGAGNRHHAGRLLSRFLERVPPDHPARAAIIDELRRIGG